MTKKCFKCNRKKNIRLFYRHSETADGYLNKCKSCTKKDAKKRYHNPTSRIKIIAYEKKREQDPERKRKKLIYQQRRRLKSPGKDRARDKVFKALKEGRLIRKFCKICADPKSEAHHTDYRKYLQVDWLCRKHHIIEHNRIPF